MGRDKNKKMDRKRREKKFKERQPGSGAGNNKKRPLHKARRNNDGWEDRSKTRFRDSNFEDDANLSLRAFERVLAKKYSPEALRSLVVESQNKIRGFLNLPPASDVSAASHFEEKNSDKISDAATTKPDVGAMPMLQPSRSYISKNKSQASKPVADFKLSETVREVSKPTQSTQQQKSKQQDVSAQQGSGGLDPWQQEALDALLRGANVIVDAPTSAGKTRVIESYLDRKLGGPERLRVVYTTPVKSLSNDKYREFCEKYGKDKIGINTGDFKENLGAPIVIATLETYRNSLLGIEPNMSRMLVVYDEYHYLQDEGRGSAWEESIILTPKESQLVLLSASVPNADEFGSWIGTLTNKETHVIRVTKRPVPLVDVVYVNGNWMLAEDLRLTEEDLQELKRSARQFSQRRRRRPGQFDDLMMPVTKALELSLGPIVIYSGRRADTENIAHSLARHFRAEFAGPDAEKLRNRIQSLPGWDYVPHDLQRLVRKFGVAYHHSGMIPPGRVAIETLLKEGLLKVCCGTMGISLGVNFAVRSAIISDDSRPGEFGEMRYSNSEVLQMLGRAGRRGHDIQGYSLWPNLGRYAEQKPREREPCKSSLKFDPSTVLGLLGQYENLAYLSEFYRKSFFMRSKEQRQIFLEDQDLLSAFLYKKGFDEVACDDIGETFSVYLKSKDKQKTLCFRCPARADCHALMEDVRMSPLQSIVRHLQKVKAIQGPVPTVFGQLARYFPQAGGMLIASFFANGDITPQNFLRYTEVMASFCSAHFKSIPDLYCDSEFLDSLRLPKLIEKYYPESLFPDLYDEPDFRSVEKSGRKFREFNPGAASIVSAWLDTSTTWDELVRDHSSRHFSAGDCMMVLFRFATFLQSCIRLRDFDEDISRKASELLQRVLRDPLDVRNRMLAEETEEFDTSETVTGDAENVSLEVGEPPSEGV